MRDTRSAAAGYEPDFAEHRRRLLGRSRYPLVTYDPTFEGLFPGAEHVGPPLWVEGIANVVCLWIGNWTLMWAMGTAVGIDTGSWFALFTEPVILMLFGLISVPIALFFTIVGMPSRHVGNFRMRPIRTVMLIAGLARQARSGKAPGESEALVVELGGQDPYDAMDRIARTLRQDGVEFTNIGEIKVRTGSGAWTVEPRPGKALLIVNVQSRGRGARAALAADAEAELRRAGLIG